MKKYDFVEVINYCPAENERYNKIGDQFIGEYAMIHNINTAYNDYQIELCFFDMELQKLAMENNFDYWDERELEVI